MNRHLEWFWKKKVCIEECFKTTVLLYALTFTPYQGLPTLRPVYQFLGIKHARKAGFLVAFHGYWAEFTAIENKKLACHAVKMAYTGCVLGFLLKKHLILTTEVVNWYHLEDRVYLTPSHIFCIFEIWNFFIIHSSVLDISQNLSFWSNP